MSLSLVQRHQNLCIHYQKRSQQYSEEKSTLLRCEDLIVSWDLKSNLNETTTGNTK